MSDQRAMGDFKMAARAVMPLWVLTAFCAISACTWRLVRWRKAHTAGSVISSRSPALINACTNASVPCIWVTITCGVISELHIWNTIFNEIHVSAITIPYSWHCCRWGLIGCQLHRGQCWGHCWTADWSVCVTSCQDYPRRCTPIITLTQNDTCTEQCTAVKLINIRNDELIWKYQ